MIVLRILVLMLPLASAVVIDCKFEYGSWFAVGQIYRCVLVSDPQITSPETRVTGATGVHESSKTLKDVTGFWSLDDSHTINFIPLGLDAVFPNLIAIYINHGRIKELHQRDIRAFTKLKGLDLDNNDITFVEKDLFKHNPELKFISLSHNKITEIHPTVFDHLTQLTELWLNTNPCIYGGASDNRQEVLELIEDIKGECPSGLLLLANQENEQQQEEAENAEENSGVRSPLHIIAPELLFFIAFVLVAN